MSKNIKFTKICKNIAPTKKRLFSWLSLSCDSLLTVSHLRNETSMEIARQRGVDIVGQQELFEISAHPSSRRTLTENIRKSPDWPHGLQEISQQRLKKHRNHSWRTTVSNSSVTVNQKKLQETKVRAGVSCDEIVGKHEVSRTHLQSNLLKHRSDNLLTILRTSL